MRAFALVALLLASAASAQSLPAPESRPADTAPLPPPLPEARDIPYPGTLRLEVDATDLARAIMRVRETIPVAAPGTMTLYLPKWLPGHHGPDGQVDKIAGVEFHAGRRALEWRRDPIDMTAYHVQVPAGASEVEARFSFLSPTASNQGRIVVTPTIMNVQWGAVALYPAGYFTRQIPISATLILPPGWKAATALRPAPTAATPAGNRITYGTVSFETLQDSPVFAGLHHRRDELGHGAAMNSFAESADELEIPADVLAKHRAMVDQAIKLFGGKHYDHYDFLNAVSDDLGGIGLEHLRSTEITTDPGYYTDHSGHMYDRNVFPHEFVHSWNGKYRRPAELYTPTFQVPMRNSLLWVYEGQTQFWGTVLEARAGMSSKQDILDRLAMTAATYQNQKGRQWRPLVDTTWDPIIQNRSPQPWGSFQRNEDYYSEAMLIWIEADAIIRDGSGGRRSMDDFARAFFGVRDGDMGVLTYTREDVIRTLNGVHPYDWATFLAERVDRPGAPSPLGGFTRSGYELRYTDEPTGAAKERAKLRKEADFVYSLGFALGSDGKVKSVLWGSPAFASGFAVGDEIVAVGERTYDENRLKDAVTAGNGGSPIRLIVKRDDHVRVVDLRYTGGLRYPRLVKVGKGPGALDRLLEPRK